MTTRATATLQGVADEWERLFDSAAFSGIVGDTSHALRGGYHISIMDQVDPANYSVVRRDDAAPPGDWPRDCAAAIDMNLGLADMKVCHGRLVAVFRNRATDPRAKYINSHNGWDGNDSAGRYDWVTGNVYTATDDHKWHIHMDWRRRYVNDPQAAKATLSILRGQSVADYLEDDMTLAELKSFLASADGRKLVAQAVWRTDDVIASPAGETNAFWRGDTWLADIREVEVKTQAKVDALAGQVGQVDEQVWAKVPDPGVPAAEKAALLRAVLGDDAAAVGALLAQPA
jgi:hypothetical protein